MFKRKIDPAEKLRTVHLILDGKETKRHAAARLGISPNSIPQWISNYKSEGEGVFFISGAKQYSKELKEQAVLDYLCGRGSQQEICQRYGIRARSKLHNWIIAYFEELQAKAIEAPKYSYGWFKALLELESINSGEANANSKEVSISFAKVEREPETKRTLILKHPDRYIPQFMEDLADIPLVLHMGEACRRQGIATEMIAFIREFAAQKGYSRIELNMWEFNKEALAFYEAVGFVTFRRFMEMTL